MNRFVQLIGHWLACKDATRLLSQLQEREPTAFERARLRWHLAACDACSRFDAQLRVLRASMRRYGR